jgi:hypothetical protein
MSRNSNLHCVKPTLEQLEERSQPSILLGGAIQQNLATPLNNMVTDMTNARTDLQVQFNLLKTPPAGFTLAQAETAFGKGAADFQRMLNDQRAITVTSSADVAFIRAAAVGEFTEGDPTDLILLTFGHFIGFDPTKVLTDPVTQANNLNDSVVQGWVNTDFFTTSPLFTHSTWAQVTVTPAF